MKCYGHYGDKTKHANCADCEFLESCKYYSGCAENAGVLHRESSLEGRSFNKDWHEDQLVAQTGLPNTHISLCDLAEFARFLLSLDDYSLGIVAEVIRGSASISELAKCAGTTRQNVHTKVTALISRVPELAKVFVPLMPKLTAARRHFLFSGGSYTRKRGKKDAK